MNNAGPLTHVVVFFIPCDDGTSRCTDVHVFHSGWRSSEEWEEARKWFERAWNEACEELRKRVDKDLRPAVIPADVATIDAIISALYESVCFLPGEKPSYDRLRSLFLPRGQLCPPRGPEESAHLVLHVEGFIARSSRYIETTDFGKMGFHEKEIARRTESFGNIVHVFSTYESRYSAVDPAPIERGINSIQLVNDRDQWWVLSIAWDVERPDNPLPLHYVTTGSALP